MSAPLDEFEIEHRLTPEERLWRTRIWAGIFIFCAFELAGFLYWVSH